MAANKKTTKPAVQKQKTKFRKFLPLISIPFIVLAAFLPSTIANLRQYPLDDTIEYIGKTSSGCYYICDSKPADTYYYATDMTPEETVGHFHNATPTEKQSETNKTILFGLRASNGRTVYILFYKDKGEVSPKIKNTNKKYIFDIPASEYSLLKSLL